MESVPLWLQIILLVLLLCVSAFFSIAETSMMALNRFRLGHLVNEGRRGARLTASLMERVERLLSTILLGNNLINTIATALVTSLAIRYFGNNDKVLALASAVVAFLIIIFCEITPKVIGATYPDRIALPSSYVLAFLMKVGAPVLWLLNLVTGTLLRLVGVDPGKASETRVSVEELRSIVIESGGFMPSNHRRILLNLFDLERITVDDVMTPRDQVEALDIESGSATILGQLTTCYHNKLPVYQGELNKVIGILQVRRTLGALGRGELDNAAIRALLTQPYFVPSGTPLFTQLQFFLDQKRRVALVVDEYGEVTGLLTLDDIMEEIVGDFTTHAPVAGETTMFGWVEDRAGVDGRTPLRDLNRHLGTPFDVDGPRTLSGWMLETLRELPDGPVAVKLGDFIVEAQSIDDRTIRSFVLHRYGPGAQAALQLETRRGRS